MMFGSVQIVLFYRGLRLVTIVILELVVLYPKIFQQILLLMGYHAE